ncbi:MAG: Lrp/AsnC family transcriptional regulator [Lachnospiraceae bacterium]|jgi:DNA-binding Lrp family transcriptional regulator
MDLRREILRILEKNSRITAEELSIMLEVDESVIKDTVAALEKEKIICGYHTLINWDKEDENHVTALIELKVTPQGGDGYNKIAEQIYSYPQVDSLYLMSGAYDFLVQMHGRNIKDIAMFVSENLASMEEVSSTATHFMLTKYKEQGVTFVKRKHDGRMVITP